MLQSMGFQRVGRNWVTEKQPRGYQTSLIVTFFLCPLYHGKIDPILFPPSDPRQIVNFSVLLTRNTFLLH